MKSRAHSSSSLCANHEQSGACRSPDATNTLHCAVSVTDPDCVFVVVEVFVGRDEAFGERCFADLTWTAKQDHALFEIHSKSALIARGSSDQSGIGSEKDKTKRELCPK